MNIRKETIIGILIIASAAVLGIAGFLLLPATLTVQVNLSGEATNTMPKALGLLIPFALSAVFSVLYMKGGAETRIRNLVVAIVGLAVMVVTFIFNL